MATWHQQQADKRKPFKLYDEDYWTVVDDPPNDCRTLTLFKTEAEAREYAAKFEHAYVLRPANYKGVND